MAASYRAPAAGAVVPATCTQCARKYVELLHLRNSRCVLVWTGDASQLCSTGKCSVLRCFPATSPEADT